MNSSEYQVTIKSANQKVDDYVTKCRPNWTVHRLKQHISETHVNKPNIGDQRLIYAGNLLKDSLTLKQIFFRDSLCTELTNSSKTDFTIHLVCSMKSSAIISNNHQRQNVSGSNSRLPQIPSASSSTAITNTISSSQTATTTSTSTNQQSNSSDGSTIPTSAIGQTSTQAAVPISTTNNSEHRDATSQVDQIVQGILQSEHMRVQVAIFQQLANAVAAQLAQNLINGSSTGASPIETNQMPGLNPSLINSQPLNSQTGTATQTDSNLATTTALASQLFHAVNRQHPGPGLPTNHQQHDGANSHAAVVNQNENNLNNGNNAQVQQVGLFGGGGQVQAQAPVVEQARAAPQLEAQDVPVVDPAMQLDVIDWAYYSIRAVLFMAALYIHASLFRLLFIVGVLAIAYFFNHRRTRRPRRRRNAAAANLRAVAVEAAAAAAVDDVEALNLDRGLELPDGAPEDEPNGLRRRNVAGGENGDVNEGQRQDDDDDDGDDRDNALGVDQDPDLGAREADEQVSALKLCYLVVTNFLASLVPE